MESIGKHKEEGKRKRDKEIKIMYTNIDGIAPRVLELKDYIREKEPEVICLIETKISEDIQIKIDENDSYNIWRKDRKRGKKRWRSDDNDEIQNKRDKSGV